MHHAVRKRLWVGAMAGALLLTWAGLGFAQTQKQKREIPMGPYFETLRRDNSVEDAVKRGQQLFNEIGCAGCHPRGGTIGGTSVDVAGNRVAIPIPTLRGAALHYPRISMAGFVADIGKMNDL